MKCLTATVLIPLESGLVVNTFIGHWQSEWEVLIPLESGLVVNLNERVFVGHWRLNPFGIRAGCEPLYVNKINACPMS